MQAALPSCRPVRAGPQPREPRRARALSREDLTAMNKASDVIDSISDMKAKGEPFALATVVRTVAATAVKAGAKAVIRPDGTVSEGWIGGGCARAAVLKAAQEAIADGQPRLVSVQPPDLLQEQGLQAGEERAGVRFARTCARATAPWTCSWSRCCRGRRSSSAASSPVAVAIADLARRTGFAVTACAPAARAGRLRRGRPPHRGLRAAGRRGRPALRRSSRRRGAATRRRCRRRSPPRPTTSPSSAAARRRRR